METKLSEFLLSEDSINLEGKIFESFEKAKLLIVEWLNDNLLLKYLKKVEITKSSIDHTAIQYNLDLIFFEEEIDNFKGNWAGCFITLYSKSAFIELSFIIHSVYQEKNYLNFTFNNSSRLDLEKLNDALDKQLNSLSIVLIECLDDYFKNMNM
jgi:hypothetical protein